MIDYMDGLQQQQPGPCHDKWPTASTKCQGLNQKKDDRIPADISCMSSESSPTKDLPELERFIKKTCNI